MSARVTARMTARTWMLTIALGTAAVAPAEDMKLKLQPIYDAMARATLRKNGRDMAKLFRMWCTPDFVYIHHDGKRLTAAETLHEMDAMARTTGPFSRSTMKIESARGNAREATITVVCEWAFTAQGRDGKVHSLSGRERTQDSWMAMGRGWKLKQIATKESSATMDGKRIGG